MTAASRLHNPWVWFTAVYWLLAGFGLGFFVGWAIYAH